MKTFITDLTKNLRKFDNPARIELAASPMSGIGRSTNELRIK